MEEFTVLEVTSYQSSSLSFSASLNLKMCLIIKHIIKSRNLARDFSYSIRPALSVGVKACFFLQAHELGARGQGEESGVGQRPAILPLTSPPSRTEERRRFIRGLQWLLSLHLSWGPPRHICLLLWRLQPLRYLLCQHSLHSSLQWL